MFIGEQELLLDWERGGIRLVGTKRTAKTHSFRIQTRRRSA